MYTKGTTIFSGAGSILVSDRFKGYKAEGNIEDFHDVKVDLDSGIINNNFIEFNNGYIKILIRPLTTCKEWKKEIIFWHHDNDDELAIILNKDNSPEDLALFNGMQEWRNWAGQLAHKIVSLLENK